MNLSSAATQDYFPAMTVIETAKPVVCGQNEVHRQPQGEHYAERSIDGPGGSVTSTAGPVFMVGLDSLFAA